MERHEYWSLCRLSCFVIHKSKLQASHGANYANKEEKIETQALCFNYKSSFLTPHVILHFTGMFRVDQAAISELSGSATVPSADL